MKNLYYFVGIVFNIIFAGMFIVNIYSGNITYKDYMYIFMILSFEAYVRASNN